MLSEGRLQIADTQSGRDGVDTVEDVELLQFSDGYYIIGSDGQGAPVLTGPNGADTVVTSLEGYAPAEVPVTLTTGFKVDFLDFDHKARSLDDIDWNAEPTHQEVSTEINYENSGRSFWDGGDNNTFAARINGSIDVEEGGKYSFRISSDDGSELLINGQPVVNFDGLHSYKSRTGEIDLPPGRHTIEVRYFENQGHAGLKLEYDGPDTSGFETVQSSDGLLIASNGAAAVKLDLGASAADDAHVALTGFPEKTILISGENSAVSDGGPVDVSDWNLDMIQIAPPEGFSGEIKVGVQVDSSGVSSEHSFKIDVDTTAYNSERGEAVDNLLLSDNSAAIEQSWLETADKMNAATDSLTNNEDVFDEPIELLHAMADEADALNSYETGYI